MSEEGPIVWGWCDHCKKRLRIDFSNGTLPSLPCGCPAYFGRSCFRCLGELPEHDACWCPKSKAWKFVDAMIREEREACANECEADYPLRDLAEIGLRYDSSPTHREAAMAEIRDLFK